MTTTKSNDEFWEEFWKLSQFYILSEMTKEEYNKEAQELWSKYDHH